MQELRANTEVIVTVGPFPDVGDGFTPQVDIDISGTDEAELIKHGSDAVVDISGSTWAAVTDCRGHYSLTLSVNDVNTEGMLRVVVQDDSDCLPVKQDYMVLAEAAWDSKYVAKDAGLMDVHMKTVEAGIVANASFAADVGSTAYGSNIIALAVRKVLDELNLDHLAKVADADDVVDDSIIAKLASTTADWSTFTNNTDSFQSIRDSVALASGVVLTAAGQQDIAQIIQGTTGVVWFVDLAGNDSNDGLSPDTAKLTPKTVIEAASAYDVVILGLGTFALGYNVIGVPNNVSVIGAGMDATWLTSTADIVASGEGAIVKPGNNSLIADMTIEGTLSDGSYQAAIGVRETSAGQAAFTRAVARNCRLIADADGAYMEHSSASSLTLIDCIIETKYDGIAAISADSIIVAISCKVFVEGPSATGSNRSKGASASAGKVYTVDCIISVIEGGSTETKGYYASAGGKIEAHGGSVYTYDSQGAVLDVHNASGTIILSGVDYDRSKTSGTITEISSAESALVANNLDHLMKTGVADTSDMTTEVANDTVLSCLMSATNTTSTFVVADDSLQGISEGAAGGGATADEVWAGVIPASPNANTAAHYLQHIDALLAGVTNTDTTNQVAFENRSGVEIRRITFGSADGSRTASTIP